MHVVVEVGVVLRAFSMAFNVSCSDVPYAWSTASACLLSPYLTLCACVAVTSGASEQPCLQSSNHSSDLVLSADVSGLKARACYDAAVHWYHTTIRSGAMLLVFHSVIGELGLFLQTRVFLRACSGWHAYGLQQNANGFLRLLCNFAAAVCRLPACSACCCYGSEMH